MSKSSVRKAAAAAKLAQSQEIQSEDAINAAEFAARTAQLDAETSQAAFDALFAPVTDERFALVAGESDSHRILSINSESPEYARLVCTPDVSRVLLTGPVADNTPVCAFCADNVVAPADAPAAAEIRTRNTPVRPVAAFPEQHAGLVSQLDAYVAQLVTGSAGVDAVALIPALKAAIEALRPIVPARMSTSAGLRTRTEDVPVEKSKSITVRGVCDGSKVLPTEVTEEGKFGARGRCSVCNTTKYLLKDGTISQHTPKNVAAEEESAAA